MNYDHVNKTYDYWTKVRSSLTQRFQASTFDEYLKKFSFCKSGKWLRDMDSVKIARPPLALDPEGFLKLYSEKCVAFQPPNRPEDGMMRATFQISPTLHVEGVFLAWVENNTLQSYVAVAICHRDDAELFEFLKSVDHLKRKGNTEDRNTGFVPNPLGFAQSP
jgi:hypothetical protein